MIIINVNNQVENLIENQVEYIKNYKPLFDNEDIESQFKIYDQILSIVFKYRNNYVLMKGYEDYYGSLFVGDVILKSELFSKISSDLIPPV